MDEVPVDGTHLSEEWKQKFQTLGYDFCIWNKLLIEISEIKKQVCGKFPSSTDAQFNFITIWYTATCICNFFQVYGCWITPNFQILLEFEILLEFVFSKSRIFSNLQVYSNWNRLITVPVSIAGWQIFF